MTAFRTFHHPRRLVAMLALTLGLSQGAGALDISYGYLPVQVLPEVETFTGSGVYQVDWTTLGITGYTNPRVKEVAISRNGWMAVLIIDDVDATLRHRVLRINPTTGARTDLGRPTDATAEATYDRNDMDLLISPDGWVSLIYWNEHPVSRVYGPSASAWSIPLAGAAPLFVEHFDQSISTSNAAAWVPTGSPPSSLAAFTYLPATGTATSLASSLTYSGATYPVGAVAGRIWGNQVAGAIFKTASPNYEYDSYVGTVGIPGDFRLLVATGFPTPAAVPGADWGAARPWDYQSINADGVVFDIGTEGSAGEFEQAAYRAHSAVGAATLITPPVGYNHLSFRRNIDLSDGSFLVYVANKDATGDSISDYDAKWTPTGGFVNLGALRAPESGYTPVGAALDGTLFASKGHDRSPVADIPTPAVILLVQDSTAAENGGGAQITLTRSGSVLFPLTVNIVLSSDADLIPAGLSETATDTYSATIPRGSSSLVVNLTAVEDPDYEADETVQVGLTDGGSTSGMNAGLVAYEFAAGTSPITVISDDVSVNPTTTITRTDGSGIVKIGETATIQVVFSSPVTGFVDGELTVSPSTGSLGSLSASGGGTTYTAVWTPTNGVDASSVTFGVAAGVAQTGTGANLLATGLGVNFDTLAPSAPPITSPTNLAMVGANLTVSGTLPSGATAVSVMVGATTQAATIASGWSSSFTGLSDGLKSITATASDAAGNESSASAISVTVDASPPGLVVNALTTPTAASGFDVSGTLGEAVDQLTIRDGTTVVYGPAAAAMGAFGPLDIGTLADGSHSIAVTAIDSLGNSTISDAQVVVVDTTGPTATLGAPSATSVKAGATPTIAVTYADAGVGLNAAAYSLDVIDVTVDATGAAATAAVSGSGPGFTITLSGLTGDGTVTVQVAAGTAFDALGNGSSASAVSATITVDNTAPAVAITTAAVTTGDTTPTIAGTAESGATIKLLEGVTELGTIVAASGTWSIDSTTLGEGVHTLTATATDAAGNVGTSGTVAVTIDLTPPAVAITTASGPTNDTTPAVSGTGEDGATVELREGATVLGSTTVASGVWTINSSVLPDGTHTVLARAIDPSGNRADSSTIDLLIDMVAPTVALGAPSAVLVNAGDTVTVIVTYADASSGLAGSTLVDDNVTVATTGTVATASVSGSGSTRTITLTGFTGDGTVTVSLIAGTATDLAGNAAGTAGPSTTITVDNTAPVVAITTPITITADPTPAISGTSDDNGATIELRDGATVLGTGTVSGGTWTITPSSALAAGAYSLTARGTDAAGNIGSDSAAVSITINLAGPTVTISGGTINGTTATFTATFSGPVSGLVAGDISVGGTAGGTRTVTITPNATNTVFTITVSGLAAPSGTITVSIPADVAAATTGGDPTQESNAVTATFTVPSGGSGGSGGSSGGGGCSAGSALGMIAVIGLVGLRRRRRN